MLLRMILLLLFSQSFVSAVPVTGLSAFYKHGQIFCTWSNLSSTNIKYRLYRSSSPIIHGNQLSSCEYLGDVRDNSSLNKEMSEIAGQAHFLKTDSLSDPLNELTGLFVTVSEQNGNFYYAITTVSAGVEDTSVIPGENSLLDPIAETVDRPQPVFQFSTLINNEMVDVYVLFTSVAHTPIFPQMINVGSLPFNLAVFRNGTIAPHPLTVRLSGGGANFLSGITTSVMPNEYRIGMDDWLPNGAHSLWFGYNEQYDVFSSFNTPPVTGTNHDYALERLQYAIDWAIRHLPIDSNSIYFSGVSAGASGAFFSSLVYPSRIAAASLKVPKFDLSFLHDPDTTNNYNAGKPGRLHVDTLIGTVPENLPTNFGTHTYDLLNGGWLAHQHANDNVPLLFAVNGKRDTMVGWAEKIPYYDSLNANRLGGFYFWDNRKHNGNGSEWIFSVNLMRYHRNVSFPAFSNCSFNGNPGDGHADSGDSLGTINGFLDWNDSITDDSDEYQIAIFMNNLPVFGGNVAAPDSCATDITLRRLQNFTVPDGAFVQFTNLHLGQIVQQDSFLYSGGLITLNQLKIFRDTSVIKVSFTIPTSVAQPPPKPGLNILVYPNPNHGFYTVRIANRHFSSLHLELADLTGRIIEQKHFDSSQGEIIFYPENKTEDGVYLLRISADEQPAERALIVVQ